MNSLTIQTVTLRPNPESPFIFLPEERELFSPGTFLHVCAENGNDIWTAALEETETPATPIPEQPGAAAIRRAARWAKRREGQDILTRITGDDILFAMLGDGILTVLPYSYICRIEGVPLDLEMTAHWGSRDLNGDPGLLVVCWHQHEPDALVSHFLSLPYLDEEGFDAADPEDSVFSYCYRW